jgi:hypothetical protein
MQRSQNTITQTTAFEAANGAANARTAYIRSLSVKITGGGFTGSGVVYAWAPNRVLIATARHNVSVAQPGDASIVDKAPLFVQNEDVVLDGGPQAHIARVGFKADGANSVYDTALILVTDRAFADAVKARMEVRLGNLYRRTLPFEVFREWNGIDSFRALPGLENYPVADQDEAAIDASFEYRYQDRYHLYQTGFGRTNDRDEYSGGQYQARHLHYLRGVVTALQASAHDDNEKGFEQLLILRASATNSTCRGDSGGPLFLVDTTADKIYFLGVTSGANYYADRIDNSEVDRNNATTIVTSIQFEANGDCDNRTTILRP